MFKSKTPEVSMSGEDPLPDLQISLGYSPPAEGGRDGQRRKPSSVLSYEGSVPVMGPPSQTSSKPHQLPEAPPSNTVTLGVRVSTYDLGGGQKHSVCNSPKR